ncbi:MAG: alanyl-tRNS synthetase [Peptoniphilus harei]|uniref:alanyl-tRNS synthetase n=1 Tax=Peptoniphilus harei TaxID=54005 RepID=UPI0025501DF1|nr:alanyl-tRNS synthetase [Peptoniphilus harei]MDK7755049.1 alanyl-tRNS synthetase [Peptoniphilus harei]MDK7760856.1 alanyl-tRNS synthetase [Peptoniphilus harei]MDK8270646.1 alanyl-tRNS synthetase [Peptoniphilus harei]MDK8339029.1 alanyl-tRNS synthetase [Peptoniphilus harei]
MNLVYKNPYKTKYKLEIIDKINRDGITYGKLENPPYFLGSERVSADQIKINGEEPKFLSGNKSYFKIDGNNKNVEIEIGWKNRLLLMQENLGNALVRHFLIANTNIDIIGYEVENSSSYIDVSAKDFKFMTAKNIESLANYAVFSNLAIESFGDHISIERLADIPYEGPALSRTGEIGMIFISSVEKLNSLIRLRVTSGENAYKLARNSLNILDNMKMYLNSDSINSVFSDVKKLRANMNSSKNSHKDAEYEKVGDFDKVLNEDKAVSPIKVAETVDYKNIDGVKDDLGDSESSASKIANKNSEEKDLLEEKKETSKEIEDFKQKEKYDANFFHEKYKLESFKDLNKFKTSSEDKESIETNKKEINNKDEKINQVKREEKYDAKFFHEKYKLESFKDLNKFKTSNDDKESIETNKKEISDKDKINTEVKKAEKYDAKFFHEKYKLESFKDLNKFKSTNEDENSGKESLKEEESNNKNSKEKDASSIKLNKKEDEERTSLFYQAVDSFKNFSTEFSGLNYIYKVLQDINLKELREISNYILKEDDFIQIYGLKNGSKSKIIILRSQNLNFDLKKIFEKLKDHFTFTGTGNMYTLDIQCKEEDLTRIMESFLIEIRREAK